MSFFLKLQRLCGKCAVSYTFRMSLRSFHPNMCASQITERKQLSLRAALPLVVALTALASMGAGCGKTSAGNGAAAAGPQAIPVQVKIAQAQELQIGRAHV